MQVAFELAAFLVLRGDQALARRAELLDQPHVAEHEARLGREVADQPLLRRVHRVAGGHRDRERAEQLAAVRGPRRASPRRRSGELLAAERDGARGSGAPRGHPVLGAELAADEEPDPGAGRPRSPRRGSAPSEAARPRSRRSRRPARRTRSAPGTAPRASRRRRVGRSGGRRARSGQIARPTTMPTTTSVRSPSSSADRPTTPIATSPTPTIRSVRTSATRAFLITTSRSHRPCLKIATRYAAGIPTKIASSAGTDRMRKITLPMLLSSSRPRTPTSGKSRRIPAIPAPATVAIATNQRICWRSSPRARRNRCQTATTVARLAPMIMSVPMRDERVAPGGPPRTRRPRTGSRTGSRTRRSC